MIAGHDAADRVDGVAHRQRVETVRNRARDSGRQVGVISDVGGLAERIGVQVRVDPQGGGRSTVQVVEG